MEFDYGGDAYKPCDANGLIILKNLYLCLNRQATIILGPDGGIGRRASFRY